MDSQNFSIAFEILKIPPGQPGLFQRWLPGIIALRAPNQSGHVFLQARQLAALAADELDFFHHLPGSGKAARVSHLLPKCNVEGAVTVLFKSRDARHDDARFRLLGFVQRFAHDPRLPWYGSGFFLFGDFQPVCIKQILFPAGSFFGAQGMLITQNKCLLIFIGGADTVFPRVGEIEANDVHNDVDAIRLNAHLEDHVRIAQIGHS